jgi:hypothetical protein
MQGFLFARLVIAGPIAPAENSITTSQSGGLIADPETASDISHIGLRAAGNLIGQDRQDFFDHRLENSLSAP